MSDEGSIGVKVKIRRVLGEEWQLYRAVRLDALATDPRSFGSSRDVELTYGESRWREMLATSYQVIALDEREVPVGVLTSKCSVEGAYDHPHTDVFGLWVDQRARRGGVAGALLRAIEEESRSRSVMSMRLWVYSDNHAALAFYAAAGYSLSGRIWQHVLPRDGGEPSWVIVELDDPVGHLSRCEERHVPFEFHKVLRSVSSDG